MKIPFPKFTGHRRGKFFLKGEHRCGRAKGTLNNKTVAQMAECAEWNILIAANQRRVALQEMLVESLLRGQTPFGPLG
jgi:hypothetical protein